MVTGTVGLLAIGMLVLSVTPDKGGSPLAASATTNSIAAAAGELRQAAVAVIGRFANSSDSSDDDALPTRVRPGLATPIGDGRMALMTRLGVDARLGEAFDVELSSGPVVTASVMGTTDAGVVVVTIATTGDGHDVALQEPDPGEIVTVMADPPVTVAFSDVATVAADEGTPVVDRMGALVGLCTRGDGAAGTTDGMLGVVGMTATDHAQDEQVTPGSVAPTSDGP